MRNEWLFHTVSVLQCAIGAIGLEDRIDAPLTASRFVCAIEPPTGPDERLLARAILVSFGLRLVAVSHAELRGHGCECALQCAENLSKYFSTNQAGNPMTEFNAWLAEFGTLISASHPRCVEERAAWLLRGSFWENLSPARLARECGCSLSLLRIKFARRYKLSLRQYLHLARVVRACIALRSSPTKVEAIARECGYRSKKDFYRVFRMATTYAPQRFRQLSGQDADSSLAALRMRLVGSPRASFVMAKMLYARVPFDVGHARSPQAMR